MNHLSDAQLNEYLDNASPPSAKQGWDAHLSACSECRARLEDLRQVFSLLAALPERPLEHDLATAVLDRLPPQQPRWTRVFAAQVGAALGASVWVLFQAANWLVPRLMVAVPAEIVQFRLPQLALPEFSLPSLTLQLPALDLSALCSLINRLLSFSVVPSYILTARIPHLPDVPVSGTELGMIAALALSLGLAGNAILLRHGSEARE